jgi:nicotinamidase-related amidase
MNRLPGHYDPRKIGEIWKVDYEKRLRDAKEWAASHGVPPAGADSTKTCLVLIDVQNTFCTPGFELFVGGRSGTGAVDDNRRLCEFIYRNLGAITNITATFDTHNPIQIFHSLFLVNDRGEHPEPFTSVSHEDIKNQKWKFNPAAADSLGIDAEYGQRLVGHYTAELKKREKFDLTIWPYHAMLGGIGHALVSAVEEAVFFHSAARNAQPDMIVKGRHPLTEHYSALGPEITEDHAGNTIGGKNEDLVRKVIGYDRVIVAGQAKSHCVGWTLGDLMEELKKRDASLLRKLYLLEDCTTPVVIPGVVDYTDEADRQFRAFAEAGMHVVKSTDAMN